MDRYTKNCINDLADRVIAAYNIQIPIKNIENVVAQMGGKIDFVDEYLTLGDGNIKKSGERNFVISVPKNQSSLRKNFTIAHELGHLFIHMGFRTNTELWDSQDNKIYARLGYSREEYEANEFAAALLMPIFDYKEQLEKNTDENGFINIEQIAQYFNVSFLAALNRGRLMGWIE